MEEPQAIVRLAGPDIPQDEIMVSREGLTIGRVPGSDLILVHKKISRRHARIFWQGQQFWVEDLGSRNGTWLRERRLQPHQAEPLNPGDTVRVGPYTLTFVGVKGKEEPLPSSLPEESVVPRVLRRAPLSVPEESRMPAPLPEDGRYPVGLPRGRSSWVQYLPGIYHQQEFVGRYLLICESILAPIIWQLDNFDMYLAPDTAPDEWVRWMAEWFDLLTLPDLPIDRLRALMGEVGWLFLRRGTRAGLSRLLALYFGTAPEIVEDSDHPHFTVRLEVGLEGEELERNRTIAHRLIESQKPAFSGYTLEMM